jgi:hypothetical protein
MPLAQQRIAGINLMSIKLASVERNAFRKRLNSAVVAAGCEPTPTAFAREFNVRAVGMSVTVHGARKWLVGEAIPTQARIHALARWLNVSAQWLRFGEEPRGGAGFAANDEGLIPHCEILLLSDFRRLDERSQAVVRDLIGSLLRHHGLRS